MAVIDWSLSAARFPAAKIRNLEEYKQRGYLSLSTRDRQDADSLLDLALLAWKQHYVKHLDSIHNSRSELGKVIGKAPSHISRIHSDPRYLSANIIGRIGLYDVRNFGDALGYFRALEDFYFTMTALPEGGQLGLGQYDREAVERLRDTVNRLADNLLGQENNV